jgi:hypothetical protein
MAHQRQFLSKLGWNAQSDIESNRNSVGYAEHGRAIECPVWWNRDDNLLGDGPRSRAYPTAFNCGHESRLIC